MKRHLFIFVLRMATLQAAVAQKPDIGQLVVHYKFTWIRDTMNRAHPYVENMELFVGKSAGAYRSYDALLAYTQFKKAYMTAMAASLDGHISVRTVDAGSRTEYYQFPNEQKLFTKDQLMNNTYLVEEPMPAIHWKISGDKANFGDLHCQKATCHFKGRDYTAWFCPDLPVRVGPWKLNGLPGVILEAHDAKNEVVFQFDWVEKASSSAPQAGPAGEHVPPIFQSLDDDPNLIALPANAIKPSAKEFARLEQTMHKDPAAFAQLTKASQRSGMPGADPVKFTPSPGFKTNNPIELPEKK